ncbi:MAG: hypothetical protein E7288_00400 [Lachnospiraceae bacterium]|nr:hypothetical protein [Lachnospiraceae bacterium]
MKKNQVGDYLFQNSEDALLAEKEAEKVMRLEEKMKDADIELLYRLYNKSLEKHTFKTPVGYDFMKRLKYILESNNETPGEVLPVVLEQNFFSKEQPVVEEKEKDTGSHQEKSPLFIWSLVTNIVLLILVIVMFWIVSTGDNPNVINYENAVINKYAEWEQELSERESLLREAGY